jgi:adenine phosphoribosyltransferase
MIKERVKNAIRDVVDFPRPGIVFKDITPIMLDPQLSKDIIANLLEQYKGQDIDAVAGIESRGFLFGYPLAMALDLPFIMIRKKGKLPYKKISQSYDLEYGSAEIEMHEDAFEKGQKILIHDDLLATGGSASAAAKLIQKCGGEVVGFHFLVGLDFLNGKEKLKEINTNISTTINY